MIWIVSKSVIASDYELQNRRQYIKDIAQTEVSRWAASTCKTRRDSRSPIEFYQCISKKGEYGIIITAHVSEVSCILDDVLTQRKALVAVNSCSLDRRPLAEIQDVIKRKNVQSELYFAKQEITQGKMNLVGLNYIDNVGAFGFGTTQSERELFQQRKMGLANAIRVAFYKVT